MKLALVHDFLAHEGGAERVLKAMQEVWPNAPTFVLFHDRERADPDFLKHDIRPSFLQRAPGIRSKYNWYLPLMPSAIESHDLAGYDVVLSSASAFAKGVLTPPGAIHISYCHTPTRYLWTDTHRYINDLKAPGLVKKVLPPILSWLRNWDRLAADRVDAFIANSSTVRDRIKKYYHRDSDVIYPPVDVANCKWQIANGKLGNYYLVGGRLVAYKRFDLVVTAFNKLGILLKVFGEGPEEEKLRAMAKPHIEFLGKVSEAAKTELYQNCIAFIHPHIEDFGITAIEAMANGRPVIALAEGGAKETVIPGVTGEFLDEQSWENLAHRIIRFKPESYDPAAIRRHAETFDTTVFKEKIKSYVESAWTNRDGLRLRGQQRL